MASTVQPAFSFSIFALLLLTFMASLTVYSLLVRRSTTHRRWISLSEWASARRLKFVRNAPSQIPPPIDVLERFAHAPRVRLRVGDGKRTSTISTATTTATTTAASTTFLQFDTGDAKAQRDADPDSIEASHRPCWNVLIRHLGDGRSRVPAGLRPAHAEQSVVDFYQLTPFHSLSNNRFAVVAVDARTANRLSKSSARALLPQDVGLLLYGEYMLLDFSSRPFDPTELDRLLSVANQVAGVI